MFSPSLEVSVSWSNFKFGYMEFLVCPQVMASSGVVTIRFIIQNTHHHKLIPILLREMSSKNREIRKVLCEVLDQLVHTWPTHSMEKHVAALAENIKKGITDADPEARAFSRK